MSWAVRSTYFGLMVEKIRAYLQRFALLPLYLRNIKLHLADAVIGGAVTGMAIFILALFIHLPLSIGFLIFVGAFFFAAYAVWREEFLVNNPDALQLQIDEFYQAAFETKRHVWALLLVKNAAASAGLFDWEASVTFENHQTLTTRNFREDEAALDWLTSDDHYLQDQPDSRFLSRNLAFDDKSLPERGHRLGYLYFTFSEVERDRLRGSVISIVVSVADVTGRRYSSKP